MIAHPDLIARINEPLFDFKQTAAQAARSNLAMLDLLLAHGADLNIKSSWEKGGFGILETVTPEQAGPLIERGAVIDVWAAAHLGMAERVRQLIDADPTLVNAKGGDGKRPLHYASTVEIAAFLLDHGAEIDALDDDHSSTPAQYLVSDRPEVCQFLLARGARSDLLMAAALGDVDRARRHLDDDPSSLGMRVDQNWFPMVDTASNGGHIYQWTLGFHVSAFDIARKRGHTQVLELLRSRATPLDRLMDALWAGDGSAADTVLASAPQLVERAPATVLRQVADAARNNNTAAVKAMLARGFPVLAQSQHSRHPIALGGVSRQPGHAARRVGAQSAAGYPRRPVQIDSYGLADPRRCKSLARYLDGQVWRVRASAAGCRRAGRRVRLADGT